MYDRLIDYSISNISATNYQNQLTCVEAIACQVTHFWRQRSNSATDTN